ncbi:MAG TPA: hypothetical protein DEG17_15850 [Cyanobacteria bacterium UBA11149]|nr:hypothetical protein [Cyanobacteria bacterium UBA11366]HBK65984.1 hypothetical protein [Cyanobacteria bacterium UBA11166]HBR75605.1 hypothetical protein [Cyanobacteria bacterium UBA11159]HBW90304.1 hypothetical protein [Cyanobacteria bacterium UBA11149]HCA95423.1 hypothetical protein [Cyanobacteria bacterium UBA9226]
MWVTLKIWFYSFFTLKTVRSGQNVPSPLRINGKGQRVKGCDRADALPLILKNAIPSYPQSDE